ncbi:MAG: hypothetical protein AABW80_01860 [Nanoarchaeota archaeon]
MNKVIPTVFAYDKKEFDAKFKELKKISKELQIDFMDGQLTETKGVRLEEISKMSGIKAEAHLMVIDPESWIEDLKKKGFKKIMVHYESYQDIGKLAHVVNEIKSRKMKAWIVFNPETNFNSIFKTIMRIGEIDGVMLMGVSPGRENQELDTNVISRIRNIKAEFPKIKIQVDGGVDDKTIGKLKEAGADIVNSGSYVSHSGDPKKALGELKKIFD